VHSHQLSDQEIECLLGGQQPPEEVGDLGLLAVFMTDLRQLAETTPAPAPSPALAAILNEGLSVHSATRGRRARPRKGTSVFNTMRGSLLARVGVAGLAVTGILGGMGAANALPGPAQAAVDHVAQHMGFDRAKRHDAPEAQVHSEAPENLAHEANHTLGATTPDPVVASAAQAEHATEPAHPEVGTETHGGTGSRRGPGGGSTSSSGAEPEHQAVEHATPEVEHATEPASPEVGTETHGGTGTSGGSSNSGSSGSGATH
jgi:hypothetical protein